MRIAVCPGSFDPITKGHLDIITRASKLFDKVIVLVVINAAKQFSFTQDERTELIRQVIGDSLPNVEIDSYDGLLANYVKEKGAVAIVKGLRAVTDFEYEFQMALANKKLNPEADTVFLTTAHENMYLSSSLVKQIAHFGGDISSFLPPQIVEPVTARLCKKD
ncbi:MAG: pantetheine-phosphate adenylyltransferase [Oscillospiraceae bacterium]|nr:pantetheine-phosphate adenylyltransferase [Oscillospiraceae bacterium]MBQ3241924.1 pantetheine-phosphate adenylyltransferase [Oscillospiraceae bacterium]MBQ7083578.1 pantetheine-phosphate adenylyltransferase [Oscillospiraceae bacterium]MBR2636251.1 pantetheine-phosphate adenylyltransferase [Oscillospiraceae bacterium]MBR6608113.1 pantetheine-phosphate adenylyltransferase [Oscillospiraceae bacterium]